MISELQPSSAVWCHVNRALLCMSRLLVRSVGQRRCRSSRRAPQPRVVGLLRVVMLTLLCVGASPACVVVVFVHVQ